MAIWTLYLPLRSGSSPHIAVKIRTPLTQHLHRKLHIFGQIHLLHFTVFHTQLYSRQYLPVSLLQGVRQS